MHAMAGISPRRHFEELSAIREVWAPIVETGMNRTSLCFKRRAKSLNNPKARKEFLTAMQIE
jgi:hypothetical protein